MKKFIPVFLFLFFVASCSGEGDIQNTEIDESTLATNIVGTITAESVLSSTEIPTSTPVTPTSTPEPNPVFLTGSGDSVIDFSNPFTMAVVKITGNNEGRHFAVINYDNNGKYLDLLVNTTDPYEGISPIGFGGEPPTTRFEITSSGEWKIEVLPFSTLRIVSAPGTIEGTGDEVIVLDGLVPDTLIIEANKAKSSHFAIISYSAFGEYLDLLVNTTDPYEGVVLVDAESKFLRIKSSDNWKIEITAK